MMLHHTPELHGLLQSVAEGHVVHHSGTCGAWPMGWSWETGAHMTTQTQSDVDYPHWSYVTALVVQGQHVLWQAVMPTDVELAVVNAFHEEYMSYWYRPGWVDRMRAEHAFDVDGGANGRFLMKVGDGNWKYRKSSWQHGPWPFYDAEPMDLLPLLDRIHTFGGEPMQRWTDWKQRHADVFAAVTA